MCSAAECIEAGVARLVSVLPGPVDPVETVYSPGEARLTASCEVAWGVIGPVPATEVPLPAGAIVSDSVRVAWFVTMKVTGPAPTELGETETRALSM
jgi:hypothetical protein